MSAYIYDHEDGSISTLIVWGILFPLGCDIQKREMKQSYKFKILSFKNLLLGKFRI